MHAVVIPLIYSRFDIVWPDASNTPEPRSGVDALTYGLATLVMREDLFDGGGLSRSRNDRCRGPGYSCATCGTLNEIAAATGAAKPRRLRRGNYFSQFTKKFSLGNGPADWVSEYLVTKESGKMLGTLICLAIARMPNLESFVWDMPTGILRDIWMALSSLGDHTPSKLSKVWVRFHDNKAALQESGLPYTTHLNPPFPNLTNTSIPLPDLLGFPKLDWADLPLESPNFSGLPALKSLTALGLDELSYLDEISGLIGRSRRVLRELRIGLAPRLHVSGYNLHSPVVQCFCLGGEMSLLLNEIDDVCDPRSDNYMHRTQALSEDQSSLPLRLRNLESTLSNRLYSSVTPGIQISGSSPAAAVTVSPSSAIGTAPSVVSKRETSLSEQSGDHGTLQAANLKGNSDVPEQASSDTDQTIQKGPANPTAPDQSSSTEQMQQSSCSTQTQSSPQHNDARLRLETLELESCLVRMLAFRTTIDFTFLTSLTLLNCLVGDKFWPDLSRAYPPIHPRTKSGVSSGLSKSTEATSSQARLRRMPSLTPSSNDYEYPLKLRRIHTDNVTPHLITFLTNSLAPNSLEWLFLQDSFSGPSTVTMKAIAQGPIRRHRTSLTKVLVDSSVGPLNSRSRNSSVHKWMADRDVLTFMTSKKMGKLRELGIVVEYKDWHFLLQRLPNISHLRSLYVPHVINHVYGSGMNIKEMAMGILDVVSLRPELELCYLGMSDKCFEILEKKCKPKRRERSSTDITLNTGDEEDDADTDDDDDDDGDEDTEDENDGDNDDGGGGPNNAGGNLPAVGNAANQTAAEDEDGEYGWSSSDDNESEAPKDKIDFKLREILFYDDKVSIFKARHAKL